MRIDCPTCAASYEVPEARLAGRRAVRCARCGSQWTPDPGAEEPSAPKAFPSLLPSVPSPSPEPAASPRLPASRPPPPRGLRLAWAASVLVLLAGIGAAVVWQAPISRAWPPSLRVYAALGLAHIEAHR